MASEGISPRPRAGGTPIKLKAVGSHVDALDVFGKIVAGDGETPVIDHEGVFDDGGFADLLPLRAGQAESHVRLGFVATRMWTMRSGEA